MGIIKNLSNMKFGSKYLVLCLDSFISLLSSLFAVLLIRTTNNTLLGFQRFTLEWLILSILATIAGILIFKTHLVVIRHSSFRSIEKLTSVTIFKELVLAIGIITGISTGLIDDSGQKFVFLVLLLDALFTLTSFVLMRVFIISIVSAAKSNYAENASKMRMMVYGVSNKSVAMLTRFESSPHYDIVGFLSRDSSDAGKVIQDKKVFFSSCEEDIDAICMKVGIDCILFSTNNDADKERDNLMQICVKKGIHILISPSLDEIGEDRVGIEMFSTSNKVAYIPDGMGSISRNVKRAVDCAVSAILIIFFSPLFLICYIAVKKEDGGPAIFKQERIGRFGRPFYILKFRSMRLDAESMGPALYSGDEDPRLTKVGKFLRQHHLDELPQLINVFKGDMAFIGPRPERQFFIDQIIKHDPRYAFLFQIRPGVTSYATLYNGYTDTMEKMLKRLELDLYYLRNRSWWFDIKILGMTFMSIVFGKKF